MIKVLIVEDSKVVSEYLQYILSRDPDIEVIGNVGNGKLAIDFIRRQKPDIITMDINMPVMDGFEATQIIMMTTPVPILIVTASKNSGEVKASMEALAYGALGAIEKPKGIGHPDEQIAARNLINMVKVLSEVKVVKRYYKRISTSPDVQPKKVEIPESEHPEVVAIGVSSGGPQVLLSIFSALTPNFPIPIVVVQHIASGFLKGLVSWLDESVSVPVKIASNYEYLLPGTIYFAPDDHQLGVSKNRRVLLQKCAGSSRLCPSVSYLFESIHDSYGSSSIAIILTGMGSDGAREMKLLSDQGALTIAQDRESSMIFGMPNEAIKSGGVKRILNIAQISQLLAGLGKS